MIHDDDTGLFGASIPIRAVLADQSASVFGSGDYLCIVIIHVDLKTKIHTKGLWNLRVILGNLRLKLY